MNKVKYFFQFIIIIFMFFIFKLMGLKYSSYFSGIISSFVGPFFRSSKICHSNISRAFPGLNKKERNKILKKMWFNYGRILAEYMFIKDFRTNDDFSKKIVVENQNILEKIRRNSKPVIFVSGHFNNFELMAMHIEKSGIELAAIYRPLNNKYLNPIMENIRKKYICKNQIKKGISGTKEILKFFKKNTSIALMIDQRVSEGVKSKLFNEEAFTTTIPAQFIKKFDALVVPIYIERTFNTNFKLKIYEPLEFSKDDNIEEITLKLNSFLEKLIIKNPDQWIWTHNRWKV